MHTCMHLCGVEIKISTVHTYIAHWNDACNCSTVDFRLFVPLQKAKIQTDQSNAETSLSRTNLIDQFASSFSHGRTSRLKLM